MSEPKVVYKIIDNNTGLYSSGGVAVKWAKEGKTWTSLRGLKLHLREFSSNYTWREHPYNNSNVKAEVVILEVMEIDRMSIEDIER